MSFLGIEIARRSLHGHQQAMNTTAHNIANINTPGYKRQEAVLQSTPAIAYPSVFSPRPGQLGTGMSAVEIKRYSDAYLDRQVREAQSAIGYWSGVETALQRVEAVLPEPTDFGIQALLGNFFSTWHYLVQDPANPGSRSAVRGAAETLANSLSLAYYSLTNVRNDLIGGNDLFAQQVGRINSIGRQIAELNREIAYQRTAGANPNDLLNRRDYLLDELSKLADVSVTVTNAELNLVSVSVYGLELVNGDGYLATDRGFTELAADHESLQNLIEALEGSTRGGLAGTFAVGARVKEYLKQLELLMLSLANAVNGVLALEFFAFNIERVTGETAAGGGTDAHRLANGWLIANTVTITVDGNPFEVYFEGDELPPGSGDWVLVDTITGTLQFGRIIEGTETIVADYDYKTGPISIGPEAEGALAQVTAEQAWAVAQIREQRVVDADGDGEDDTTLDGYYQQLVTGIGADLNAAQRGRDNVSAILGQIEALRESVSGVNLDEELTRMIQYQYGYQAAARVITVLDELLDTLINRML
ncbi:flagellar hook-associated protein FlgK [Candidatus Desulforudis audaxviator]|uniref:Flagellar hook-associated protein 1 n=1 Tax=Desulforudis audaxviator (strain MP104C) TaxID=477974 RepID=B1I5H6_DESAP|nr:flagellar hook-associated protein FlgK [Candidatus Desulforudis audaxviator]ACA60284.1 flagellar hook-associated protein FlgK [Candidatus Desulforudis audaxviator MP104C]AZK60331.1 Flagellar hook-associated protein FlgK [Candidatus Desulforudis audaxviator]